MRPLFTLLLACSLNLFATSAYAQIGSAQAKVYPSFLQRSQLPDGLLYLPAPPDTTSMAFFYDIERHQWGKSLRATARGRQAASDADQSPAALASQFSEAFGQTITKEATPELFRLVELLDSDCGNATYTVKKKYLRKRPYVQFNETTAIPASEAKYRPTGSYPSGHSATGWGVALVLAEINPDRQEAILLRGYEIGQSRVIAGYHYQSDVDIARLAGSAAIARLHADEGLQKQLTKAKREFARLKRHQTPAPRSTQKQTDNDEPTMPINR